MLERTSVEGSLLLRPYKGLDFDHNHNGSCSGLAQNANLLTTLHPRELPSSQSQITVKVKVKPLSHVRLFATPRTIAYQVPPSMGFSQQENHRKESKSHED